jgi:hypothetical protein
LKLDTSESDKYSQKYRVRCAKEVFFICLQQIRQTVLTRAGGRGQSSGGQLDEAPETEESAEVGMSHSYLHSWSDGDDFIIILC